MPGPDQQARTNTESALGTTKTNVAFGRIAAQVSIAVNPLGEREGVQRPLTGPVTEKTGMVSKAIVNCTVRSVIFSVAGSLSQHTNLNFGSACVVIVVVSEIESALA